MKYTMTMTNEFKIKLLEGNIRSFQSKLAVASDKDSITRQIQACKQQIKELKNT